jgi:hypothetical protein
MTNKERLQSALRSAEPARTLRSVVQELARAGQTKEEVYHLLEELLLDLRGREDVPASSEDAVLDVMDALTGWCHPDAQLIRDPDMK